jgi:serine/threonine protein kinase
MDTPRQCPSCGKLLESSAPRGLCPACLLQAGFATGTQMAGGGSMARKPAGFVPPSPAELAESFPQLEIQELIGQGGMGAVYRARQPSLDRAVALKILPPHIGEEPGFAERFTREARALASLSHPNIVAVHDFGQSGGFHYFIMEYVDGLNLRQIERAGKLAPREALQIIPQICEALQYAHDEGIVHRDIKPENILVDRRGRVKIADFGLAKLLGGDRPVAEPITEAGHVMGTPHYMAPEQVEKPLEVDHRADIYSLGVVFYEMLTGELPLGRFPAPSHKAPVDQRFDDIVLRALEKEPGLRFQQASQIKTAVETLTGVQPEALADKEKAPESSGTATNKNAGWFFSRYGWLVALCAALAFLGVDSIQRMGTIAEVTDSTVNDAPEILKDANSLTGYQFNQHKLIIPTIGTNGYAWMMETERMLAGLQGKPGFSGNETSLSGANIHWSSSLHWLVLSLAWVHGQVTGQPSALGVAWAAPWANTLVLAMVMAISVPVIGQRFGAMAASLLALGFVAAYPYYEFFIVGYFYQHGLTATCLLLQVLGLAGGGGGWLRNTTATPGRLSPEDKRLWQWLPERSQARRWFVVSALLSGIGLWLQPNYELLALAGVSVGAVLGAGWLGRGLAANAPGRPEPSLWRLWGQVGAVVSLLFSLVEYLPANFSSRLESLLLSLAWLGAGDLLARVCQWLNRSEVGKLRAPVGREMWWMALDGVLMALLPAVSIVAFQQNFFTGDSFLWSLKTDYIMEFRSLFRVVHQLTPSEIIAGINLAPLVVLLVLPVLRLPGLARPWKGLLNLVFFPALVFLILAFYQIRYLGVATALALGVLATMALVTTRAGPGFRWTPVRGMVAVFFVVLVYLPYPLFTVKQWISLGGKYPVTALDHCEIVTRDVSCHLRQRLGPVAGAILSGPTTTSWMMFFGGFGGLGNINTDDPDGLKAAAAVYSAPTDDDALALINKYGITHLVIFSWDAFASEYDRLAYGLGRQGAAPPAGFVAQLLKTGRLPRWLRPLPYKMPKFAGLDGQYVLLYEVHPEQTREEAAVRVAQCMEATGNLTGAKTQLLAAVSLNPDYLPGLIVLASLQQSTGQEDAARKTMENVHDRLDQADALSWGDRVELAGVLLRSGDATRARDQMHSALAGADEASVRRLLPEQLQEFVRGVQAMGLSEVQPDIYRFATGLLPEEQRAQLLSGRAGSAVRPG